MASSADTTAPALVDLAVAARHLAVVRAILAPHVPDRTVVPFGSRVGGSAKPPSDLGLAILGEVRTPPVDLACLASDFEESDLPFRVDLVEWAAASPAFRARVERGGRMMVVA